MIVHMKGSMHVFIVRGFLMGKKKEARLTTCMISSSFRLFLRSKLVVSFFVVWFLGYQGLRIGSMAY